MDSPLKISLLYTTIDALEPAKILAKKVLEAKKAVCGNIVPHHHSMYHWEGSIEHAEESSLLFKTLPTCLDDLEAFILTHHPYDVPAILKWEVTTSLKFYEYLLGTLS